MIVFLVQMCEHENKPFVCSQNCKDVVISTNVSCQPYFSSPGLWVTFIRGKKMFCMESVKGMRISSYVIEESFLSVPQIYIASVAIKIPEVSSYVVIPIPCNISKAQYGLTSQLFRWSFLRLANRTGLSVCFWTEKC